MTLGLKTETGGGLSNEALLGLSLSFLVASLADSLTSDAGFFLRFDPQSIGFTDIGELPLIAAVGLTPIIAAVIRKQPVWQALVGGQLLMLLGAVSLLIDSEPTAPPLSLAFSSVGRQMVAAAFLIAAWRSRPPVTALLAGVFVLPTLLSVAVSTELFMGTWPDKGLWLGTSLGLLLVGLLATYIVFLGEPDQPSPETPGFPAGDIAGLSLILIALTHLTGLSRPDSTQWTGPALLALVVGGVLIGVGRQNRKTPTPAPHVDPTHLVFVAAAAVLSTWITASSQWLPFSTDISFDRSILVGRVTSFLLIITLVPLVVAFARAQRRLLSAGTLAIAAAGLILLVFRIPDLQAGIVDIAGVTMLSEWGLLVIVGVAVALSLRRADSATLEFGVIFFLGFYVIIQQLAANLAFELVGVDLFAAERTNDQLPDGATDNLRLFVIATTIALVTLSAWWATRPTTIMTSDHTP